MTLPGSSSQFASADTTQSLRSARANPSSREITTRMTTTTTTASTTRATKSETHTRAREKRHGCWMCEKSFDRPSTLRKHLLVHTGVKAFVCETCGRRFGVASNLNRHIKRCVLKPVNLASRTGQSNNVDGHSSNGSSVESAGTSVPESSTSPAPSQPIKRTREPEATEASEASAHSSTTPPSATDSAPKPPTKRRRRAPSPSQWVPQSLAHHNILPFEYKGTPVPLPPVSPTRDTLNNEWIEERNSWDDDTTPSPYHPYGWKGILPGPGLASGAKDGSDDGLVNGGTYVMGRLVMV
ncbi:hypothetical protein PISMIDRAFT_29985 [Pisolithus microcarpus 441]|uniref:pH-response transcription factor pacC/RIM101 n=1 Tax=Pisolithus microcarpus 441 TaxID=765257 RepID=A0A0C9Y8R0_9AGAM|nr:hypothetical protein PISMIDRAFT_29985 [Pisolithus microcarpus 441]